MVTATIAGGALSIPLLARACARIAGHQRWSRIGRAAARVLAATTFSNKTRAWIQVGLAPFGARARAAGRAADRALRRFPDPGMALATMAVNAFIFAGRYRDALALDARLGGADSPRRHEDPHWPIYQINLAEAEYNLGQWDRAAARLAAIAADAAAGDALTRAAFAMQSAWIAAHTGRADARALAIACVGADLGPDYRSEFHFVHATAHLAARQFAEARAEALRGLAVRRRRSSERNAHYLLARIALAAGDGANARAHFARGAAHPYRGQGGPELLLYGEALTAAGEHELARQVFGWALERDPESPAAEVARARLGERRFTTH